ncbi:MAG TPA: choice-of-anchor Q domain-containing protein [Anaerolineales bacterium]|nr:choice-of-anchor Q domain-containing protein [Anaerolineales bacterium]
MNRTWILVPVATALVLHFVVPDSSAKAVITVTTTDPAANPGDSFCSLIEALDNANTDSDTSGGDCPAGAGPDTIVLAAASTYTLSAAHNTTDGPNGLPSITSVVTIEGGGSTLARSAAGGTPEFRILHVSASGNLTLNAMTVQNGYLVSQGGGGILIQGGVLTLNASTVQGNSVENTQGGGIANVDGAAALYDSFVMDNAVLNATGTSNGGGLANRAVNGDASLSLDNTEVVGNSAGRSGGGVFNVAASDRTATLTIENSLVSGNTADQAAGGIWSTRSGPTGYTILVVIDHSTIRDNVTPNSTGMVGGGGIINNYGEMLITHSLIEGNLAVTGAAFGGGVINAFGTLMITHSTISGNEVHLDQVANFDGGGPLSGGGGGLVNSDGTMTVVNTTISGNVVTGGGSGGGILNAQFFGVAPSNVVLINTTVSENRVDAVPTARALEVGSGETYFGTNSGGGLSGVNFSGGMSITYYLQNTIIAGNFAPDLTNCDSAAGVDYVSNGHNLEDGDSCNLNQPTDLVNTDPLLGPLQDNGGPTWTHALLAGSPAVDAADDAVCSAPPVGGTDQRGVARPSGPACDIGAFEWEYPVQFWIYLPIVIR